MRIVRLKPDTDLSELAQALSAMRPERDAATRFALVTAQGEGQNHAFLVAADKKSNDWTLLKTSGPGSQVTLSAVEASGQTMEMTGKVDRLVEGRSFGAWATSYFARVLGLGGSFAVGACTALYSLSGQLQFGPTPSSTIPFAVMGLLAAVGAAATYPRLSAETGDRDYARKATHDQYDGKSVEGRIKSVTTPEDVKPVAALPAPTEAPLVIPFELARAPVAVPVERS